MRVGPCHDYEFVSRATIHRRLQTIAHFLGFDQRFAGSVTATFVRHLVFNVATGRTRATHFTNGSADHERTTPAGVRIDQQRQIADIADAANVLADIVQCSHGQVRQAERGVRDTGTGQVDRLKTGLFREQCRICVDRTDDL